MSSPSAVIRDFAAADASIDFKAPTPNPSGQGKSAFVKQWRVYQTPTLKVPFGLDVPEANPSKKSIFAQGDAAEPFFAFADQLAENTCAFVANNDAFQASLFGAGGKGLEVIQDRFHKLIASSDEYGAGMRFKLNDKTKIYKRGADGGAIEAGSLDDLRRRGVMV